MRVFISFAILFCLTLPITAQAQNVFLKQENTGQHKIAPVTKRLAPRKEETKVQPPPAVQTQAAPQSTQPAQTQTAISADIANRYYKDCAAQKSNILSAKGQEMLCACTSVKMTEEMSLEEIKVMFGNTPDGQRMRNKMLMVVYTPCMEFPAHDLVYKSCTEDTAIKVGLKKPHETCECLASNMAGYVVKRAPAVLTQALQNNAENLDPLALLVNSSEFDRQSQTVLRSCLARHELGNR